MSPIQIQIAKIIVGIAGIIASMLILYYAIKTKDINGEDEKIHEVKINYEVNKNTKREETVILDNIEDSTVILDDKNKDDTICL